MSIKFLAINKDVDVHHRETQPWLPLGVSEIRVDSMTEGIDTAQSSQFLFIAIDADNIDFLPILPALREVTNAPIYIVTSAFTVEDQIKALHNGADFYGGFSAPEKNMRVCLAVVDRIGERARHEILPRKVLVHEGILLIDDYQKVFINDVEVSLTRKEMLILHYLLLNRRNVLTYEQIYEAAYGEDLDTGSAGSIYSIIKRLRKKLWDAASFECIETVKDVGYRLLAGH